MIWGFNLPPNYVLFVDIFNLSGCADVQLFAEVFLWAFPCFVFLGCGSLYTLLLSIVLL